MIERVFGRPLEEVFEDFPNEPLGIGAVAQVRSLIGVGVQATHAHLSCVLL